MFPVRQRVPHFRFGEPTMQTNNNTIPLRKIRRRANPRTYRNPGEFAELRASVKVHGVIQPILVRPIPQDGEYEY